MLMLIDSTNYISDANKLAQRRKEEKKSLMPDINVS